MAYTEEQLRAAAKKAYAAGDTTSAQELYEQAQKLKAGTYAEQAVADSNMAATRDRIASAKAGTLQMQPGSAERAAAADAAAMGQMQDAAIEESPGLSRSLKVVEGLPFIGSYFDEFVGKTISPGAQQRVRGLQDAMTERRPWESTGLNLLGGVMGAAPLAAASAPAVVSVAPKTMAGKVIAGGVAGAAAGGTEGAVSGYGRGEGDNRGQNALRDGLIGAGFGGGLGAAAPALSAGATAVVEWAKRTDIDTIAKTFGISRDAAKALRPDLEALDFNQARANLTTAGPDAMIADAGIPTREALDAAITGGGKAARIGIDAVSERAARAGQKLDTVLDATLGAPKGVKTAAKNISTRTAGIRKTAYDKAYSTAINYADMTGRKIEEVLSRIPDATLNSAISEANEAMQAAGITNLQIMAQVGKNGKVTFVEMPNVQQLDEIKKALGTLGAEVDNLGRPTAKAIRAKNLARELRDAVGDAVPSYKTAVKLGGDKIAEDQALDMGRKVFGPAVTREAVADMMKDASLEAKDAARQGIREYIDNTLARVRRDFDAPDVDTQETLKLLGTLTSRDARTKLELVLGPDKAQRLLAEIDSVGKQFGTRRAIAAGSATGRRTARKDALDNILAPGVIGTAAETGNPFKTIGAAVRTVTRQTPEALEAQRQNVLAEVANALTTMRGPQAQNALAIVQNAIEGQPIKSADAARIGRLFGGSTALGGYLSGTQALERQVTGPR